MLDSRKTFITKWNKLNIRLNYLINMFTLSVEEYNEFNLIRFHLNEMLKDDAYYFGFEDLQIGTLIE